MEKCKAPSEVSGITTAQSSTFGRIAENLIYADFCAKNAYGPWELFADCNNPGGYFLFLSMHNPTLNLKDFAFTVRDAEIGILKPDLMVHSNREKVFYEVKPDSWSGKNAGEIKVGELSASYKFFNLPYRPGLSYTPMRYKVAFVPGMLSVEFVSELKGPGLILYRLCLSCSEILVDLTVAAILSYVIGKMNEQVRSKTFRPIDLRPEFAREGQLSAFARSIGLVMAAAGTAVAWRFFWKAVIKRFAVRGATAAVLEAATGPFLVGDLVVAGMAIWTVVDIIRLSSVLWADAAVIAKQET